ncbi:MAG: hypothetical protein IPP13_00755 [Kouleothrix sp.]|nr:hypothetical protein [Kouleothrix sp.]
MTQQAVQRAQIRGPALFFLGSGDIGIKLQHQQCRHKAERQGKHDANQGKFTHIFQAIHEGDARIKERDHTYGLSYQNIAHHTIATEQCDILDATIDRDGWIASGYASSRAKQQYQTALRR